MRLKLRRADDVVRGREWVMAMGLSRVFLIQHEENDSLSAFIFPTVQVNLCLFISITMFYKTIGNARPGKRKFLHSHQNLHTFLHFRLSDESRLSQSIAPAS